MENCIVKELKSVVDNDSLMKLGEIILYCGGPNADDSGSIGMYSLPNTTVELYNISDYFDNNGVDVKTANVTSSGADATYKGMATIKFNPQNIVYFGGKSNLLDNYLCLGYFTNLKEIKSTSSTGYNKPSSTFKQVLDAYVGPELQTIAIDSYDLSEWNFSDLVPYADNNTYKNVNVSVLRNTGININIADLAYFKNTVSISIEKTYAHGSIEDYVQIAREKWPLRNSMAFKYGGPNDNNIAITFNGQTVGHQTWAEHRLTWTATQITFDGVTITA